MHKSEGGREGGREGGGERELTQPLPQILNGVEVVAHGCGEVHENIEVQRVVDSGSHADSEGLWLTYSSGIHTSQWIEQLSVAYYMYIML